MNPKDRERLARIEAEHHDGTCAYFRELPWLLAKVRELDVWLEKARASNRLCDLIDQRRRAELDALRADAELGKLVRKVVADHRWMRLCRHHDGERIFVHIEGVGAAFELMPIEDAIRGVLEYVSPEKESNETTE